MTTRDMDISLRALRHLILGNRITDNDSKALRKIYKEITKHELPY